MRDDVREQKTTFFDVQERYERDTQFHSLVDLMVQFIIKEKYTPQEMRDAAFMASIQFDRIYRPQRFIYTRDDRNDFGADL